jgi:tripartite-type tricarboxylate transporter receptor subunit TctC
MSFFLRSLIAAAVFSFATVHSAGAFAPDKPVRLIVPFPAGGAVDFTARLIAQRLAEEWRQNAIVENQAGANGNVGAEYVARSKPDGTVLLVSSPGVFTTNRFIYRSMPYDPDKDLAPVSLVMVSPNVLVVGPQMKVSDLRSLLARARAEPEKLTYASQGVGSTAHLSGALMSQLAKIDIAHIPYRGDAPALNDLIGGHVSMMWNSVGSVSTHVRGGKLKAVAVGSTKRSPALPDIPTAIEAGLLGFESVTWFAMGAPGTTPKQTLSEISASVHRATSDPAIQAQLATIGAQGLGSAPDELRDFIASETSKWKAVIERARIAPQ